jgi:hypothetical protein
LFIGCIVFTVLVLTLPAYFSPLKALLELI